MPGNPRPDTTKNGRLASADHPQPGDSYPQEGPALCCRIPLQRNRLQRGDDGQRPLCPKVTAGDCAGRSTDAPAFHFMTVRQKNESKISSDMWERQCGLILNQKRDVYA